MGNTFYNWSTILIIFDNYLTNQSSMKKYFALSFLFVLMTIFEAKSQSRGIRIEVTEDDEKVASINLPLNMLKFLIKTARITNKSHIEVEGQEIPIDINELEQILNDPTFKGRLLDVNANDEGKNIKVLIEVV